MNVALRGIFVCYFIFIASLEAGIAWYGWMCEKNIFEFPLHSMKLSKDIFKALHSTIYIHTYIFVKVLWLLLWLVPLNKSYFLSCLARKIRQNYVTEKWKSNSQLTSFYRRIYNCSIKSFKCAKFSRLQVREFFSTIIEGVGIIFKYVVNFDLSNIFRL